MGGLNQSFQNRDERWAVIKNVVKLHVSQKGKGILCD